jgi:RNAse (barnase) inhibitor barstar
MKQIVTIDSTQFNDISSFAEHFSEVALGNKHHWNGNLDAFNDIFRGGFGSPDGGFAIVWRNHAKSQKELGRTFNIIIEIIKEHGPGGDEAEDGIELNLQ